MRFIRLTSTKRLPLFTKLWLFTLCLAAIPLQAQSPDVVYKRIKLRSDQNLYLGKNLDRKIPVPIPQGTRLIELEREDQFWVRIAKTERLKTFIQGKLSTTQGSTYPDSWLQEDWYLYDYSPERGFDSDPEYFLKEWLSSAEILPEGLSIKIKSQVHLSLISSLVEDLSKARVDAQFSVQYGNSTPIQTPVPQFRGREMFLFAPKPALLDAKNTPQVLIRWTDTNGIHGASYAVNDAKLQSQLVEKQPSKPGTGPSTHQPSIKSSEIAAWVIAVLATVAALLMLLKRQPDATPQREDFPKQRNASPPSFPSAEEKHSEAEVSAPDAVLTSDAVTQAIALIETFDAELDLGFAIDSDAPITTRSEQIIERSAQRKDYVNRLKDQTQKFDQESQAMRGDIASKNVHIDELTTELRTAQQASSEAQNLHDQFQTLWSHVAPDTTSFPSDNPLEILEHFQAYIQKFEQLENDYKSLDTLLDERTEQAVASKQELADTKAELATATTQHGAQKQKIQRLKEDHDALKRQLNQKTTEEDLAAQQSAKLHEHIAQLLEQIEDIDHFLGLESISSDQTALSRIEQAYERKAKRMAHLQSQTEHAQVAHHAEPSSSRIVNTLLGKAYLLHDTQIADDRSRSFAAQAISELQRIAKEYETTRSEAQMAAQCARRLAQFWMPPDDRKVFTELFAAPEWNVVLSFEVLTSVDAKSLPHRDKAKVVDYIQRFGFVDSVILEPSIEHVVAGTPSLVHEGRYCILTDQHARTLLTS